MNNIVGRIKLDTLTDLFNVGHLPNPDTLTTEVQVAFNSYNAYAKHNNRVENKPQSGLIKLFNKPEKVKPLRTYNRLTDFVRAIKSGYFLDNKIIEVFDGDYIVDLWHKIQDIRCVLEVRCVAKNSQSNYVLADKNTMLSIKRVIDNQQKYLKL